MRKHMALVIAAVLVVAALLVFTVAFTVDELRDIVMVKQFGRASCRERVFAVV